MKRLLVLSNGAGEDAIACRILKRLPSQVQGAVICCPLVGPGKALETDFEFCGPRVLPPSEGLFREDWRLALKDLARGVIAGHLRQLRYLHTVREEFAMAVAVGDLFPVLMAGLSGLRPLLFVGTAKSVYHHPYSWFERWLLRRLVDQSLVRDQATAQELAGLGLAADWLGNAMMDEVQPEGKELPFTPEGPVLTLFPGSRSKAPEVLPFQLAIIERLTQCVPGLQAGVAVAPGTQAELLTRPATEQGWEYQSKAEGSGHLGCLTRGECQAHLLQGVLGDLLTRSTLALGQAGTANEQAAGAGVPVVAYDPRGEKGLRWYRKRQKGLLGDAVAVVAEHEDAVFEELYSLLRDPIERERRATIGRERMGPAGGTQRMAEAMLALWNRV